MADIGDRAQELDALYRQSAIDSQRAAPGVSARNCIECDFDIPQARRAAFKGVQRCIDCQEELERGRC